MWVIVGYLVIHKIISKIKLYCRGEREPKRMLRTYIKTNKNCIHIPQNLNNLNLTDNLFICCKPKRE